MLYYYSLFFHDEKRKKGVDNENEINAFRNGSVPMLLCWY